MSADSWLYRHPGTDLLLGFGASAFLLWFVAYKIFQGTGVAIAQAISPNQNVPAGSHVVFNNGDTTVTTTDTNVGTLQANGVTQYTTPSGVTFSVPPAPVPGAFA